MAGLLSPPQKGFLPGLMADPWFRLGMALLEQGGPSPRPHSVGQDISRAFGSMQEQDQVTAESELRRIHLEKLQREQELAERNALSNADFMRRIPDMMAQMGGGEVMTPPAPNIAPPPMEGAQPPAAMPAPQRSAKLQIPEQYAPIINRVAMNTGIPREVLAAQIQHESSWNPNITGKAGELGLSQFIPDTARQYGLIGKDFDYRANPEKSIEAQGRYMADLLKQNKGDMRQALWRYNASPDNPAGGKYADTVLELAGLQAPMAAQAAPAVAPQTAPPAQPSPQQFSEVPIPKHIEKQINMIAYADAQQAAAKGGNAGVAFAESKMKRMLEWQMQAAKTTMDAASKEPFEIAKAERESELRKGEKVFESSLKDEEEYDKKVAGNSADKFTEMVATIPQKQADLGNINAMIGVLSEGIKTGFAAETVLDVKQAFQAAGIDIDKPENIGKAEFFRANSNKLLFALRQQQAQMGVKDPNPSNADLKFQEKIIPSMGTTPAGNMLLLLQMKRQQEMSLDLTSAAQAFAARNGGRFNSVTFGSSKEATDVFKKYRLTEPMLDQMVNQATQMTSAQQQPAAMPKVIKTPAERDALPPGTIYIAPDGSRRIR